VKLDFCVVVTPLGDRQQVFVALRPQRFAPLFEDRFQRLVRDLEGVSAGVRKTEHAPQVPPAGTALPVTTGTSCNPAQPAVAALLLALSVVALTGCQRTSLDEARKLVERYNQVVSEAYRRGDVKLVDPVVGPREGKKLTGLIGVRLDLGITLDAELISLEVIGTERLQDDLRVRTRERWRYRDLKIGTGEQVGQESLDSYEMLYVFKRIDKAWLVDEIKFTSPPQVGRTQTPWIADRRQLHGMNRLTNSTEVPPP
jgi:hypothetical protein